MNRKTGKNKGQQMKRAKKHMNSVILLACVMALSVSPARAEEIPGRDDKIVLCYMVQLQDLELAKEWPKLLELPFNGMIFRTGNHQKILGPREIPWSDWQQVVDELKSVDFGHFRDNFLYMSFSSGYPGMHVNWFDDWTPVIANLKNMARAAKLAGLKGLMWDPEGYGNKTPHFHYPHPKIASTRTQAEHEARVRELAEQIIREICEVYPDITILSLFGYTNAGMNMLPTFLDGLLAGSDPRFTLVDGQEGSYYYKDKADFARRYAWMRHPDGMGFNRCGERDRWARQGQGGFGLFVTTGKSGTWQSHPDLLDMNYFNPPDFRRALANAVNLSDRYVWLYTEATGGWLHKKSDWYPHNMAPVYLEIVSEMTGVPYAPSPGAVAALSKVQNAFTPERLSIARVPPDVASPVIDGDLLDPAWEQATHVPAFVRNRVYARLPLSGKTEAWITYDADALYAAWRCHEPDMTLLITKGNAQRDSDVYSGDSVELWITPGTAVRPAYQVIINPENHAYDSRDLKPGDYHGAWRSAVIKREGDWQVELALPWTDLGVDAPQAGDVRRANLNRIRRGREDQLKRWRQQGLSTRSELSSWSPYDRGFAEITNLGYWVFE